MVKSSLTPLAAAREEKGISLSELSAGVAYDRGGLSRIERGLARPRVALANRIVEFFEHKITRDQIMFPEDYPSDPKQKKPSRRAVVREAR